MTFVPGTSALVDPPFVGNFSINGVGQKYIGSSGTSVPSSGSIQASRGIYSALTIFRPYNLQRFFWANGGTVGTNSIQVALYATDGAGAPDYCVASTARTLSAGTANTNQYAGVSVVAHGITSGTTTTDATSFATASVTLKARPGVMYALSVVNTHGSSANTVTCATTGGAVTFTSRNTTQFNGTLSRVSLFTALPSADVTDTITITIGSGQTATACLWSLVAFTNVDTTTNDGIVQTATATGNSTTPSATLSAFASANNATFGAHGTAQTAATPGSGFIEVHDVTASTPTCGLETEYTSANDTSVDATITSAQWGTIAAEVASRGTTATIAPGLYALAFHSTGTTMTVFRVSNLPLAAHLGILEQASLTAGLPLTPTYAAASNGYLIIMGITNRATP